MTNATNTNRLFSMLINVFDQAVSGVEVVDPSVDTDVLLSSGVTHMEEDPMNMLSLIASLTPFSDFNQRPRNMYQCQMGKQTMGTPAMALAHRTDNKMYRLQTPMAPIVQNRNQSAYKMDEYVTHGCCVLVVLSSWCILQYRRKERVTFGCFVDTSMHFDLVLFCLTV